METLPSSHPDRVGSRVCSFVTSFCCSCWGHSCGCN